MKVLTALLTVIGSLTVVYTIVGLVLDVVTFDQTKGGYEYPYEGWSGEPVDWDCMDLTSSGLVKRGHVIDVHVHGTTGMISFEILGRKFDWRKLSDRALKVHKPREGLKRRGFNPEF